MRDGDGSSTSNEQPARPPRGWTETPVVKGILTLAGLAVAFYALPTFVDSRIETKLSEPEFIRKISPPYVIFDSNSTIHVDSGATKFIQANLSTAYKCVEGESDASTGNMLVEVAIEPKQHLASAPLLTVLEGSYAGRPVTSHRTKGFNIVLRIHIGFDGMHLEACQAEAARRNQLLKERPYRMRLEIIR